MKKSVTLVILCILLSLSGCNREVQTELTTGWFGENRNISYGEQGMLSGQNRLYYMDSEIGSVELICSDAACKHGKNCSASFKNVLTMRASIEGNKLLLVTDYMSDKLGDLYLYEAALDGSNRKKIEYLGNLQNGFQYMFLEDYIVFDFWNSYDEDMVPLEEDIAGVYVYNKNTGEGKVVWRIEGLNARIPGMAYWGDCVYFFSFYIDGEVDDAMGQEEMREYMNNHQKNQFCKLSLRDGTVEVIDDAAGNFFGAACMEGKIFCNYDFQLYMYDMSSNERILFSDEDYRPQKSMLDDKVIFWKDSEYFVYSDKEGMQSLGQLEKCMILAAFPHIVYAEGYAQDTYEKKYMYFDTEDFLKGDFDKVRYFNE